LPGHLAHGLSITNLCLGGQPGMTMEFRFSLVCLRAKSSALHVAPPCRF
jgi:hypothetical protein